MNLSVFIIGPSGVGKTLIANNLADIIDTASIEQHSTVGVRILEISKTLNFQKRELNVSVEIWDCSGDPSYYSLWPAVTRDAHAIIYVGNDEVDNQLETWQSFFPQLNNSQIAVISLGSNKPFNLKKWSGCTTINMSNQELNTTQLKSEFDKLLYSAYNVQQDKREKEEAEG